MDYVKKFVFLLSMTTSVRFSGNDNDHIIDACYSKNRFLGQIATTSTLNEKNEPRLAHMSTSYSITQPNPFWRPSLTPGIRTYASIERTSKQTSDTPLLPRRRVEKGNRYKILTCLPFVATVHSTCSCFCLLKTSSVAAVHRPQPLRHFRQPKRYH